MLKSLRINIILLLSSIIIITVIIYIATFFYFTYLRGYNEVEVIKYKEEITFIKKYSKKLHHVRHHTKDYYKKRKPSNLLFSEEAKHINKLNPSFLFLGDSWFEQLISYQSSRDFLKNFFNDRKVGYINAGISSYSPTLMSIQYNILKNDFKISPDYVVVYIDQTDFGDELCRYKKNKYFSTDSNQLIGVSPDLIKIPKLIRISEISASNSIKIIKDIKIFNFFLNLRYQLAKNKILKLSNKDQRYYGCSMNEIFRYLISPSNEDLEYFKTVIKSFLEQLQNSQNLKNVILVSFPHRNQITTIKNFNDTEDYKFNISDLIDEYLEKKNSHKFYHLNFTKLIELNQIIIDEKSFIEKDQASHLNEEAHLNIFSKKIADKINQLLD